MITVGNKIDVEINKRLMLANRGYFGLKKQLSSQYFTLQTKTKIYKTILRPIITYGSESWTLTKLQENKLKIFERKILRRIFGPICENGVWRSRYNDELYTIYGDTDVVKVIKSSRVRWLGHLFREKELDPCRKVTLTKIDGKRKVGRPPIRWMDSVEHDLKTVGVYGWRRKAEDRSEWRRIVGAVKACNRL